MLKATNDSYGSIAKIFHWVFAIVIFWQLFTGINLHNMEFSPQKGQFIWFHQITGTFIFCFIALRLVWRFYNKPKFENTLPKIHKITSKTVQIALYVLCFWLPIQGTMMTWAGGYDVYLVGLIKIPTLMVENKSNVSNLRRYPLYKLYGPAFINYYTYFSRLVPSLYNKRQTCGMEKDGYKVS